MLNLDKFVGGVQYHKYQSSGMETKEDDENIWKPECDGQPFLCDCGSTSFSLFYPIGSRYQLNARCTNCKKQAEVYSG